MKRVLTIICALMITAAAMAELTWKNENLKYGMYLGPIKAGQAQLVTENITYNGQKAVRMRLIARTTKIFFISRAERMSIPIQILYICYKKVNIQRACCIVLYNVYSI